MNPGTRAALIAMIRTLKSLCDSMEQILLVPNTLEGQIDSKIQRMTGAGQDPSELEYMSTAEEDALGKAIEQGRLEAMQQSGYHMMESTLNDAMNEEINGGPIK